MIIQQRKVKCDECGKVVETDELNMPRNWLGVSIVRWMGSSGTVIYEKEVCCDKCALKTLKKLKKVPKEPPTLIL